MTTRYAFTGMLSALAIILLSCTREADSPAEGQTLTIKAVMGESTKTAYEAEKTFSWLKEDQISLQTGKDAAVGLMTLSANEAGASTSFSGTIPAGFTPGDIAFYPQDLAQLADNALQLELPASFTPNPENPMSVIPLIGRKGTDGFVFHTATGILKITVTGLPADAQAVTLSHESAVLCGSFAIPEGEAILAGKEVSAGHSVSARFTPAAVGETRSFYFPLPVGEIPAGLQVILETASNGQQALGVTSKAIAIPRNQVVAAAQLGIPDPDTMFKAYIYDSRTKTTMVEQDVLQWLKGDEVDAVVVKDGIYSERRYQAIDEGQEARFLLTTEETAKDLELCQWAFYPSRTSEQAQDAGYNLSWDIRPSYYEEDKALYPGETEIITIDLPAQLSFPAGNPICVLPMLGQRQEDLRYCFKPMTGILALQVSGMTEDIDFVSLKAPGKVLSGSFHLNQKTGTISQDGTSGAAGDEITFTFSGLGEEYTFYLPVIAGEYPELSVTVGSSKDMDTSMEKTMSNKVFAAGAMNTLKLNFEPKDQQWAVVTTEASFQDDFLWDQHSAFISGTYVQVTLERSGLHPNKYRINNPYRLACEKFNYTPYTQGIESDDYLIFSLHDDGIVRFIPFRTGIEDRDSGGKPMMITHPLDWSGSKKGIHNKVVSALNDGTPLEIELAPIYSDPDNSGYMYTRDGEGHSSAQRIHIVIPDTTPESWSPVLEGEFIDELIWSLQGWGTGRVSVVLEQSNKLASRLRVANPYLKAAQEHGYTPYTADIEGSEYIEINLLDDNLLRFATFFAGIEDKASGGKPMKVWYPSDWGGSYDVSYNKVLSWRTDHLPIEMQLAAVYSGANPSDYSYKYTKNTSPTLHFYFPDDKEEEPEDIWAESSGEVQFLDSFIWGRNNNFKADTYVKVALQKSTTNEGHYRMANPYLAAAAKFGYSIPSGMAQADEYLVFTVDKQGLVSFPSFVTGVNLDANKSLSITHPTEWAAYGGTAGSANNNLVSEALSDGTPGVITLEPIFHESGNYTEAPSTSGGYYYPPNGSRKLYIRFPGKFVDEIPDDKVVSTHLYYPVIPNFDLPITRISVPGSTLQKFKVKISGIAPSKVEGVRIWGSGWIHDSYVPLDQDGIATITSFSNPNLTVKLELNIKLKEAAIGETFSAELLEVVSDGTSWGIIQDTGERFHPAVRLNHSQDRVSVRGDSSEVVQYFRIPALVTAKDGTLIAAYDVRYDSSVDLQNDIDIGVKFSKDGGKTWSPLMLAMDMGVYGYESQIAAGSMTPKKANQLNGIGDPCLLVDEVTGEVFCFAIWTHGHEGYRALGYAGTGYDVEDTPQLMMVRSSDSGQSWSAPINITRQVKRPEWRATFQGPGRGITMKDGTLVIPFQHQENGHLNSGVAYSTDRGEHWHSHNFAHPVTSESAVAEIEPGVLLLTMRDETNSHYRRNFVTRDLGRSWTAHSSNGQWVEPTCEASMLHVDAADNALGKDLLLFSNPANSAGRSRITIKASLDKGVSFAHELLVDEGGSLGYSCLTMVDKNTVGILYESSKGNIVYQSIPLTDIIK